MAKQKRKSKAKKPTPIQVPVKRERREKFVPIEEEDFPDRISHDELKNLL